MRRYVTVSHDARRKSAGWAAAEGRIGEAICKCHAMHLLAPDRWPEKVNQAQHPILSANQCYKH